MNEPVTAAKASVCYNQWITSSSGDRIPQSTNPATIEAMLRLLDLDERMRVLEIGTGSGYSGALLAHIVGPAGSVTSVDIDRNLTDRASYLHELAGNQNVEVHTGDGFLGWADTAPYDRIVGWTTPHVLPNAWVAQTSSGGVIVSPVAIADVALANGILRCRITDGRPHGATLHPGSFIEMASHPVDELDVPSRYVDAVYRHEPDLAVWTSAHALHSQPALVSDALTRQLASASPRPGFLPAAHCTSFIAYLVAVTDVPASAGTVHGWGTGVATRNSIAVVLPDGSLLAAGTGDARSALTAVRERWRRWFDPAHPGYQRIIATLRPDPDGWTIRPNLQKTDGTAG